MPALRNRYYYSFEQSVYFQVLNRINRLQAQVLALHRWNPDGAACCRQRLPIRSVPVAAHTRHIFAEQAPRAA